MLISDITRPAALLAARIAGDAYGPGDAAYDEARTGFVFTLDLRPAIVALPETAEDVVAIVEFAREQGLRLAPQATGHNAYTLEGDLSGSILVKLSRMRGVEVDTERRVARAEAGAWWIDVTERASAAGLAPLSGSSPDVGVAGYTLGGGVSWLARKHGLSANNVVAIELVTPDGRLVRADHVNEPDLFWALRGGGGNFGIVTAIELRLFDLPEVYAGMMVFPFDRAAEVLKAWRGWTETAPEEATTSARLLQFPPIELVPEPFRGASKVIIDGAILGDEADAAAIVEPLRALGPEVDTFAMVPPVALSRIHLDPEGAVPEIVGAHAMLDATLDDAAIDQLVAVAGPGSGSPLAMVEMRHLGGALHRTGADHGALDTLPGQYLAFVAALPEPGNDGLRALVEAYVGKVMDAWAPHRNARVYSSFIEEKEDTRRFFGPEAHDRLLAIRAAVDPDGRMQANHQLV